MIGYCKMKILFQHFIWIPRLVEHVHERGTVFCFLTPPAPIVKRPFETREAMLNSDLGLSRIWLLWDIHYRRINNKHRHSSKQKYEL